MDVIAIAEGFDGTCLRQPGEQFEMPEGSKGSWFYPAGSPPPKARGRRGAPPQPEGDTSAGSEA